MFFCSTNKKSHVSIVTNAHYTAAIIMELEVKDAPVKFIKGMTMTIYKPLWEYIDVIDYMTPSPPTGTMLQNNLKSAWRRLNPFGMRMSFRRCQMQAIPAYLLNRAAKTPDLHSAAEALFANLQQKWGEKADKDQLVQVVVGPPGSQIDKVVNILARQKNWQMLGPPTANEILSGGNAWLENIKPNEITPIVIPLLGKCFFRHQDGLALMEKLLDKLQNPDRNYLIACDSWAWAYLEKVLHIDAMLSVPLTLAPLDGTRLQFWLPTLAQTNKGQFVFRDSDSGQLIFPATTNYEEQLLVNARPGQMEFYGEWVSESGFLKQLTAYSRGIPQIIWLIWRECLQIQAKSRLDISARFKTPEDWYTVWVKPLSQLSLPAIPIFSSNIETMVLHALLLHGGVSIQLLDFLLPYSHNEIRHAIATLSRAGLVVADAHKAWQVTLLGYPAVRRFMYNEGYLVDAF